MTQKIFKKTNIIAALMTATIFSYATPAAAQDQMVAPVMAEKEMVTTAPVMSAAPAQLSLAEAISLGVMTNPEFNTNANVI